MGTTNGRSSPARASGPAGRQQRRRLVPVVDGFQKRFVVTQLAWMALLLGICAVIFFAPAVSVLLGDDEKQRAMVADRFLLMHGLVWPLLAAFLMASGALTFFLTHRVAGPLYRFRRVFSDIERGVLTMRVGTRKRDYLQEEAAALGRMVTSLRERIGTVKRLHASARASLAVLAAGHGPVTPDDLTRIDNALDRVAFALGGFDTDLPSTPALPAPNTAAQSVSGAPPATPWHRPRDLSRDGFSLIELMIVTAIIVILAAFAMPAYAHALTAARTTKAIGDLKAIEAVATTHRLTAGCLPSTLADMGFADLRDPWGRAYAYAPIAAGNRKSGCTACSGGCVNQNAARKDKNLHPVNSDFDVYSMGPDGQSVGPLTAKPSRDDIIRGNNGGFFGLGRDF